MVKINELRLGNMITYGAHGLVIVNEIKASGKIRVTHIEQSSIDLGYIDSLLREVYLDPIPLTEEWLKKMGFEGYAIWKKGYFELEYGHFSKCFQFRVGEWLNDIVYVHHLQNLYFALTAEELTIKETV